MVKTTQLFAKQKRKATIRKKQSTKKRKRSKLNKKTKKKKTQSRRNVKNKTTKKLIKRKKTRKSRKVMKGGVLERTERHKQPEKLTDISETNIENIAYSEYLTDEQAKEILTATMNIEVIRSHNRSLVGKRAGTQGGLFLCRGFDEIFYTKNDESQDVGSKKITKEQLTELIVNKEQPFPDIIELKLIIIPFSDLGHTMEEYQREIPPVVDRTKKPSEIFEKASPSLKWLKMAMTGVEAEAELQSKRSGAFLIRKSQINPELYVLSFNDNNTITHVKINQKAYGIAPEVVFANINDMVKHYTTNTLRRHFPQVSDQFKLIE
jgi:hypothetical protein